jgi:hypothetical protein
VAADGPLIRGTVDDQLNLINNAHSAATCISLFLPTMIVSFQRVRLSQKYT